MSSDRAVVHDTVTLGRRFPVPPATVFAAFSDAAQRARSVSPATIGSSHSFEQDFRVGGREESRFGRESPDERRQGWGKVLQRPASHLDSADSLSHS